MFKNKTVLVTGGTGSFGNTIVKRLLKLGCKEIRILSRDEKKQYDMRYHFRDFKNLNFFLGDIRDKEVLKTVMANVNIVYHAAALKQVPNCENFPFEAIKTNILGARNLIETAMDANVESFIAVSTDKAVKPVNVMGMTKALQERLIINANFLASNTNTKFCCVRYGNVMNSRGSVIPLFKKQIEQLSPLTITHNDMTRFMLTLNNAIDLVLFATNNMKGGEIFVKKAPSVKIVDLAKIVLDKFSKKNLQIETIGTYPGEKIHEILISEEEMGRCEEKDGYYIIYPRTQPTISNIVGREYSSHITVDDLSVIDTILDESEAEAHESINKDGFFS